MILEYYYPHLLQLNLCHNYQAREENHHQECIRKRKFQQLLDPLISHYFLNF